MLIRAICAICVKQPTTNKHQLFNRKERKVLRKVRKEVRTISFDIVIEIDIEIEIDIDIEIAASFLLAKTYLQTSTFLTAKSAKFYAKFARNYEL